MEEEVEEERRRQRAGRAGHSPERRGGRRDALFLGKELVLVESVELPELTDAMPTIETSVLCFPFGLKAGLMMFVVVVPVVLPGEMRCMMSIFQTNRLVVGASSCL